MAFRYDVAGSLRPPKRLPDGRVRVDAYLTRTGVFVYRNADGSARREYRPPEEVFHADALESFAMVPVTDDHPAEAVTAENAKDVAIGWTGELVRRDGDHVAATVMLADARGIAKADAGKREVSCGYTCDLDETPGALPSGERYDAIQRNIRGNHVALVDVGRAGPTARIRMDAAIMVRADAAQKEDRVMEELQRQLAAALSAKAEADARANTEKARADKAEGERDAAKSRADKLEAERDAEKARADQAEKARTDAADAVAGQVRARVELERKAGAILGEADVAKMSDREIKAAVVKKVDGAEIAADKSDAYVDARFDSAVERADSASDSRDAIVQGAGERKDALPASAAEARQKMVEVNRNAWKAKE